MLTSSLRSHMMLDLSNSSLYSTQAFYAAEAGIEDAIDQLRRNPSYRPTGTEPATPILIDQNDPKTARGVYQTQVLDTVNFRSFRSVWVKSVGNVLAYGKTYQRSILARVVIEDPASFFISTPGDLHIQSGSTVDSVLGGRLFFDVDDSKSDSDSSKVITINGDMRYINNATGYLDSLGNLKPSVHITLSKLSSTPALTFPNIDLNYYRALASGGRYDSGNLTISGDLGKDSSALNAPNGLVFAEGDIHISGNIKDSILIVAGGNIYIDGDITYSGSETHHPQIGLLASKDVIVPSSAPNDLNVEAYVKADGAAGSKGGIFMAEGTKFSKGTLNFIGAMSLKGNTTHSAADLNVYQSRNYTYNPDLKSNRTIPFLTFIANIVRWEEVEPAAPIPAPGATPTS